MKLDDVILELCAAAGPAGFEESVSRLIEDKLRPYVDEIKSDVMGNLIAVKRCGKENAPSVLLDAHMDEIGLMVTGHENGYLRFNSLGGIDPRMLPAAEVTVLTEAHLRRY